MKKEKYYDYLIKSLAAMLFVLIIMAPACSSDSEDEVKPDCDLDNVTYSATVAPVMAASCNGCHSAASPSAGVITANYEGLREIALDGRLVGSINHAQGYSPMPKGQPQLDKCPRDQIAKWVEDGAPEN